jgi:hypothetical protein
MKERTATQGSAWRKNGTGGGTRTALEKPGLVALGGMQGWGLKRRGRGGGGGGIKQGACAAAPLGLRLPAQAACEPVGKPGGALCRGGVLDQIQLDRPACSGKPAWPSCGGIQSHGLPGGSTTGESRVASGEKSGLEKKAGWGCGFLSISCLIHAAWLGERSANGAGACI